MPTVSIPRTVFLPKYRHLVDSTADINFLYGGRDSGKSHFIAQKLIEDCLRLPYFRCLLIKKTYNSIGESQWRTIKDIVESWGISHLFHFRTAPLSIECINGNRFLARGCDDPQSIKSVKDPSHAWYEEGNMLTLDDFITVTTTLRTNRAKIQQWFSFNPECEVDYEDFWLYKTFFKDKPLEGTFKWTLRVSDNESFDFIYTVTHSTYHDNPYCTSERKIFLEQLKEIDFYYYLVYTLGKWGNRAVGDPYCLTFDKEKHVKPVELRRGLELYLSFDFNVNPITCGVYQHYNNKINCKKAIKRPNSDIYELCGDIKIQFPDYTYLVTGDATGRNRIAMVKDGINYYTIIKNELRLSLAQLKVPTVNPIVKENRVLVNAVFRKMDVSFDPEGAKDLIFDCQHVSVNDVGDIVKGSRENPKKRADHLDHFRYYLNTFHRHILKF